MKLAGQRALISGGSRGLGLVLAGRFIAEGARVAICGRDESALAAARAALGDQLIACRADVTQQEQVAAFVRGAEQAFGGIDVAVCNAGILGPIGGAADVDWEAWKQTIEVNLFGAVLLCREVAPVMKRQRRGKIIALSGGGATAPRPRFSAYATAKAGLVRFVDTLAAELAGTGIEVNAVAPGALNTRLLDEVLAAGGEAAGEEAFAAAQRQRAEGGASFDKAADLAVFLASHDSDGVSGRLLSAVWDDWRALAGRQDELAASDVYTLRRIVPADRAWPA